ncbi:hypothetical protein GCM10018962_98140 [Dactylosporangium matsuzakiense]
MRAEGQPHFVDGFAVGRPGRRELRSGGFSALALTAATWVSRLPGRPLGARSGEVALDRRPAPVGLVVGGGRLGSVDSKEEDEVAGRGGRLLLAGSGGDGEADGQQFSAAASEGTPLARSHGGNSPEGSGFWPRVSLSAV